VTVAALIKQAGADGLRLWADGEGLAYEGPADVVERWKPRIVASKPEIMAALTAPRLTWWLVHYLDGASVEVWSAPPATEAEVLERRPDANAAQPLHQSAQTPISTCKTCSHATFRGGCGEPVEAGLSGQSGVIAYHPTGGADCATWEAIIPPDLELLIQESATKWQWNDDDVSLIQHAAQIDPTGLRIALNPTHSFDITL
jgi:hypothetical protein